MSISSILEMETPLEQDLAAFEAQRSELEARAMGKWVLFHNATFIGVFDTLEAAAEKAVAEFGAGPYLLRQIGSASVTLPASVMFRVG